jgi:hypothetical protein
MASLFQKHLIEYGVEVSVISVPELPDGYVAAGGFFDWGEWDDDVNIELVLMVKDENKPITINITRWEYLEHEVLQTLEHEMIHRGQMMKRCGLEVLPSYPADLSEEQERIIYLSDPDELDAYANDVFLDLLRTYNYLGIALKLQEYSKITEKESPMLYEYVELFGADSDLVKRIVKKVIKKVTN